FGVMISTLVAIPVIVFAPQALALFHVTGPMADLGTRYLRVVMLSEPFQGIFLMCASGLRGAGDTRTPLWIGGLIDLIAIFLNYVLIFGKFGAPFRTSTTRRGSSVSRAKSPSCAATSQRRGSQSISSPGQASLLRENVRGVSGGLLRSVPTFIHP